MKLRPLVAIAAALPLAACLSFGEKPPKTLMTLSADQALPPGTARTAGDGQAVTVIPPSVPQELNVLRVPVQTGATGLAYLKDAQWIEPPSRLFRNLLAETIAVKTNRPVLDIRQYSLAPGIRIAGRLTEFGLDADRMEVVVNYDATLARGGATAVQTRRFEARVPVAAADAPNVAAGLNRAANQVAGEVADWVGG